MEDKKEVDFLTDGVPITLAGHALQVKAFSVGDFLRFGKVIAGAGGRVLAAFSADGHDVETATKLELIPYVMDELPALAHLIARAVEKDGDWLLEQRDIAGFTKLLEVICDLNDFTSVIKNFTHVFASLKKQAAKAKEVVDSDVKDQADS